MCLKAILDFFKKPEPPVIVTPSPHPEPPVIVTPVLTIPHPQEPQMPAGYVPDLPAVIESFIKQWHVSERDWIGVIDYRIDDTMPDIAHAHSDRREVNFQSRWCTEGVMAHETAHIQWFDLTEAQRQEFISLYKPLFDSDPYMKLLKFYNTYWMTSDCEAHAEIYRYLGGKMPQALWRYYPHLIA